MRSEWPRRKVLIIILGGKIIGFLRTDLPNCLNELYGADVFVVIFCFTAIQRECKLLFMCSFVHFSRGKNTATMRVRCVERMCMWALPLYGNVRDLQHIIYSRVCHSFASKLLLLLLWFRARTTDLCWCSSRSAQAIRRFECLWFRALAVCGSDDNNDNHNNTDVASRFFVWNRSDRIGSQSVRLFVPSFSSSPPEAIEHHVVRHSCLFAMLLICLLVVIVWLLMMLTFVVFVCVCLWCCAISVPNWFKNE